MTLPKRYEPKICEPDLQKWWQEIGVYQFNEGIDTPNYVIDTPPPTVSGNLHLGHVYSYSHADFFARFQRMNGFNVLYPMGYDDNGLPTERLVEKKLNIRATEVGRTTFIEQCLAISDEAEDDYQRLWQRLALSIDWRSTYRTIDSNSRRISQLSFLDLLHKGLAYRRQAPTIWCPECQTAIAQAELNDINRPGEFVTLRFWIEENLELTIATTRPELLPACVAVFVHPDDSRYQSFIGHVAEVPIFGQRVPILADPAAEMEKGTGAVMCCTFGDTTDINWWYSHNLNLAQVIGRNGRMTEAAGPLINLTIPEARKAVEELLSKAKLILDRQPADQSIRVHERCDTPVEYIVTTQWFVRILDRKEELIERGNQVKWHPDHMEMRFIQWVENLNWDWCISRQRYYGVPFPVWYCTKCGEIKVPSEADLPVDPLEFQPTSLCDCGNDTFDPERDVMDTWATSSLTPQLVGSWLGKSGFDGQTFVPLTMRTQAHEIIRTWAFYSIVKAHYHFDQIPWKEAVISGWGLSPAGAGKISKSRGGGLISPIEMIERYSADSVRYWAASTSLGKDAIISEERIQAGEKLVNKIWNVFRFAQSFLRDYHPPHDLPALSAADRWLLSSSQDLIRRITKLFEEYDYATAKSILEVFFWNDLADNYLEMVKRRLYNKDEPLRFGAVFTLDRVLFDILKMFSPFLPHVTEQIYLDLFESHEEWSSIHLASWPQFDETLYEEESLDFGKVLIAIATVVRRFKSENSLGLGTPITALYLLTSDNDLADLLKSAEADLSSITRAEQIYYSDAGSADFPIIVAVDGVEVAIKL